MAGICPGNLIISSTLSAFAKAARAKRAAMPFIPNPPVKFSFDITLGFSGSPYPVRSVIV